MAPFGPHEAPPLHGRNAWKPGAAVRHICNMLEDLAGLQLPVEQKQQKGGGTVVGT